MSQFFVYVIDDEEDIRDALSMLLNSAGYQVKAFASATAFLQALPELAFGCVLLDVRMPKMSGLALQAHGIEMPIIFMSGHGDIPMAVKAVQRGALDFLVKPFNDQQLLSVIERAQQSSAAASAVHQQIASLTPREHEVMALLLDGLSTKVIARQLAVSPRTVEIHRSRVLHKLNVENAQQLVAKVINRQPRRI